MVVHQTILERSQVLEHHNVLLGYISFYVGLVLAVDCSTLHLVFPVLKLFLVNQDDPTQSHGYCCFCILVIASQRMLEMHKPITN